ncbi:sulfite oxidase [Allobranchiibius sp. GilTou38]|uniref:sulfite oxidase n=1 Tax=Allobranchiibius sp. GilTou38 TaxID=2815210 RepID=UPI001AA161A5|nr:sulfite oxidase [Allobranchiibius sp. GilTou38]MBO1766667.1 sulfite oxidase [Allobranchiibius sp. GilTou38]
MTTSWGKRADMLVHEEEPFNAEPTSAALAASYLTPTDTFYSRNHGPIPTLDRGTWRLDVDGLVDIRLRLSLAELQDRFEEHVVTATVQCAGNRRAGLIAVRDIPGEDPWQDGATSTAVWAGIRLADVLAEAGVTQAGGEADETHVAFQAPDVSQLARPSQAYGGSIPLAKATRPEVLLAWSMNGEALTPVHGAPLRVVVPGWIGARSVKWLERIIVRHGPSDNYFQSVAYRLLPPDADPDTAGPGNGLSLGPIALNSAILSPADDSTVSAGALAVSGYAFAGDGRRVARVDVSPDGGHTWVQADLGPDRGPWAWRLWRAQVHLAAGDALLVAQAWDGTAAAQPSEAEHLWNPKGYVNNACPRARVHAVHR